MKRQTFFLNLIVVCFAMAHCFSEGSESRVELDPDNENLADALHLELIEKEKYELFFDTDSSFLAYGFDYPIGIPDASGYYNAQGFGQNGHLGDDWNGTRGGNTDLGDPVYCVANGYVSKAYNAGGGWGNIVRVIHKVSDSTYVESLYAHLDSIHVTEDSGIMKGEPIGTIGDAGGIYLAHLHLEIRDSVNMPLGGGYSSETSGYLNPTQFINKNRRVMWKVERD